MSLDPAAPPPSDPKTGMPSNMPSSFRELLDKNKKGCESEVKK